VADAPYELADELDFAERADALAALPPGDARTALRAELAAVLGARLDRALASGGSSAPARRWARWPSCGPASRRR
jgi:hypothetical protein